MKITRIEVPSRVKEMLGYSLLDSSLRNPSTRNDYSEDRTGIGTNLSDKIPFGLANGARMAFIDHIRYKLFSFYKRDILKKLEILYIYTIYIYLLKINL
ncbi:hypothetical protein ALC56_07764 [Trachymyrmex septentrionalis]|uniref:Uncharacterized protein n=1 Tax=Trachymyrmex septentrionalis TaxID=34720 RepID=A0A195FB07_9HYME|nr:hypothetical protein ALC56_07764 [Trachymyrmex septentrionalis]